MGSIVSKRRRKRIDRLFYQCAITAGRKDDAWEHYRDKIVVNLELRIASKYRSLTSLVGVCGYDLVYRKVGRAVIMRKVMLVVAMGNIVVMYLANYDNLIVLSIAGIILALIGGTVIVRRQVAEISRYLASNSSDMFGFFKEKEIKKTVRRHKRRLPGKAVGPHSFGHIVILVLKADEEILEIVNVLYEDWEGSAVELIAAAHKLL